MGRRSINTTKSGKFMNPTDQARKEARKRELRKNKKQRMLVRAAVLKGKDPFQIIADMERLDQMEYNVNNPPPLNEKVLKDKRRKMKETWDRLCRLYMKEDHDRFLELKRLETEYEGKRNQMVKFYESVKSAQEVSVDDIPLPSAPLEQLTSPQMISEQAQPPSILKRHHLSLQICTNKHPPGVPPGPPPALNEIDASSDDEDNEREKSKKIRFSDDKGGDKEADVNEFLKEIEIVEKSVRDPTATQMQTIQSLSCLTPPQNQAPHGHAVMQTSSSLGSVNPTPAQVFMFRPPVGSSVPNLRMMQQNPAQAMMPNRPSLNPNIQPFRPGMPIPRLPPPNQQIRVPLKMQPPTSSTPNKDTKKNFISDRATIEAKPQLRNLSADATRFTPVALRVKREDKLPKKPTKSGVAEIKVSTSGSTNFPVQSTSKDDAYDQFMKEMENLM